MNCRLVRAGTPYLPFSIYKTLKCLLDSSTTKNKVSLAFLIVTSEYFTVIKLFKARRKKDCLKKDKIPSIFQLCKSRQ